MKAAIQMKSMKKVDKIPSVIGLEGYLLQLGEDEVPIDFYMTHSTITFKDGQMLFTALVSDFDADTYENEWEKLGYEEKDLTAERLGATTKLIEVNYECYADDEEEESIELEVVSFTFIDGEKEFAIAAEVIAAYNQKVLEEQA